jgi:hypothetical protein
MRNKHYVNVAIVAICLVISGWALAKSVVLAVLQNPDKVIIHKVPHIGGPDPLEITEIKVKGRERKAGEGFVEDGEWLNDTTFKLTNTYSKPITYLQLNVNFPDVVSKKYPGATLQYQILLGRHPIYKADERPELLIMPGGTIEVSLASEYKEMKRMIELSNYPVNSVNRIEFNLSEAAFNDGTLYSGGRMYERNPDPNGRQKWIQIKQ